MVELAARTNTKRISRLTLIWLAVTVVTAPVAYGFPLIVTLPVLAALCAQVFVRNRSTGSVLLAWVLGPTLLITVLWFALRVDEVPGEGVLAAGLVLVSLGGLLTLRLRA